VTAIPLGQRLRAASSNLPERQGPTCLAGVIAFANHPLLPFLFGLAPGGVCHAVVIADDAVRSYRTFSPLPRLKDEAVPSLWHFP